MTWRFWQDNSSAVKRKKMPASFFQGRQHAGESVGAFILRLQELFFRWREWDEGRVKECNDLLLDQLLVGLQETRTEPSDEMHDFCRCLQGSMGLGTGTAGW